ncbi:MAG TPA: hypothetical protein VGL94_02360 [Ktedonobacteraceae bacterium]|jgi:hypothetical protein
MERNDGRHERDTGTIHAHTSEVQKGIKPGSHAWYALHSSGSSHPLSGPIADARQLDKPLTAQDSLNKVNPSQLRPERLPDGHKPPTASDLLEAWEPQQESPVLDHYAIPLAPISRHPGGLFEVRIADAKEAENRIRHIEKNVRNATQLIKELEKKASSVGRPSLSDLIEQEKVRHPHLSDELAQDAAKLQLKYKEHQVRWNAVTTIMDRLESSTGKSDAEMYNIVGTREFLRGYVKARSNRIAECIIAAAADPSRSVDQEIIDIRKEYIIWYRKMFEEAKKQAEKPFELLI